MRVRLFTASCALLCLWVISWRLQCTTQLCTQRAEPQPRLNKASAGDALVDWVIRNNGTAGVHIRLVNGQGLLGTVATQDYRAGDTIIALPQGLAVALLPNQYAAGELAFALMRLRQRHPEWWASMQPYWDSLPAPGAVLREHSFPDDLLDLLQDEAMGTVGWVCWTGLSVPVVVLREHSFPDDLLDLLQDEAMAAVARGEREFLERLFNGTAPVGYEQGSLAAELPGLDVALPEFQHWATLCGAYSFAFPRPSDGVFMRYLLPLLGNMNHAGPAAANVRIKQDRSTGAFVVVAKRDIAKGTEVTYTYNNSLQRNDASLMKYGFIQQADPPRLCGVDLPGGQLGEVYEGLQWEPVPYSALASREEMARLSDILTAFPTTAEEDAALLAGSGAMTGWQRLFVEFRMQRKLALQSALAKLAEFVPMP